MPTRHHHSKRKWKPRFLAALAQCGVVRQAAQEAGVQYQTVFAARDFRNRSGANLVEAQAFAQAWDSALAAAADSVETEIRRRALLGVERERPIYYRGEQVGTQVIRLYSDRLLMFLARALHPQVYGEHPRTPPPLPPSTTDADLEALARQRWLQALPMLMPLLNPPAESTEQQVLADPQPNVLDSDSQNLSNSGQ